MYVYIYTYLHTYIYIYKERERARKDGEGYSMCVHASSSHLLRNRSRPHHAPKAKHNVPHCNSKKPSHSSHGRSNSPKESGEASLPRNQVEQVSQGIGRSKSPKPQTDRLYIVDNVVACICAGRLQGRIKPPTRPSHS